MRRSTLSVIKDRLKSMSFGRKRRRISDHAASASWASSFRRTSASHSSTSVRRDSISMKRRLTRVRSLTTVTESDVIFDSSGDLFNTSVAATDKAKSGADDETEQSEADQTTSTTRRAMSMSSPFSGGLMKPPSCGESSNASKSNRGSVFPNAFSAPASPAHRTRTGDVPSSSEREELVAARGALTSQLIDTPRNRPQQPSPSNDVLNLGVLEENGGLTNDLGDPQSGRGRAKSSRSSTSRFDFDTTRTSTNVLRKTLGGREKTLSSKVDGQLESSSSPRIEGKVVVSPEFSGGGSTDISMRRPNHITNTDEVSDILLGAPNVSEVKQFPPKTFVDDYKSARPPLLHTSLQSELNELVTRIQDAALSPDPHEDEGNFTSWYAFFYEYCYVYRQVWFHKGNSCKRKQRNSVISDLQGKKHRISQHPVYPVIQDS